MNIQMITLLKILCMLMINFYKDLLLQILTFKEKKLGFLVKVMEVLTDLI